VKSPEYSITIPVRNEESVVKPLVRRIESAMKKHSPWEVIIVDDHSTDGTADILAGISRKDKRIKSFSLQNDRGKDYALAHGFIQAEGSVVITLDGDLQNPPEEIPNLLEALPGNDMVCGFRVGRRDSLPTKSISAIANAFRRKVTGDDIRDAGCALRAFRSSHIPLLVHHSPLFRGNAHYFYPMLIRLYGGSVRQIPVTHLPRLTGKSKFSHVRGRLFSGLWACAVMRILQRSRYRDLVTN